KAPQLSRDDLSAWKFPGAAIELVFVDGQFVRELSAVSSLPAGVEIGNLKERTTKDTKGTKENLGRYLNIERDAFAALNTAFINDGAFVSGGGGVVGEQPIRLLFFSTPAATPRMVHPRNLFIFEQEGQGTVVEEYVSLGGGTVLSNSATELV